MVAISNYPSCCGAYVFTGFSGADEHVRQAFVTCARTANNRMKWSFVLNDDQVRRYPLTLAEAHRMGFVLSNSWINYNHDSQLYEFERCGERVTANAAAAKIGWVGRVLTPNIGGLRLGDPNGLLEDVTLENTRHISGGALAGGFQPGDLLRVTRQDNTVPVGSIVIAQQQAYNEIRVHVTSLDEASFARGRRIETRRVLYARNLERVEYVGPDRPRVELARGSIPKIGDICRVTSTRSRYYNRELPVIRVVTRDYDAPIIFLGDPNNGEDIRLALSSVAVINPVGDEWAAHYRVAPPRNPPAFNAPFQEIHVQDGEEQWRAVRPANNPPPVEAAAPQRAVVHTLYRARYRDGRDGAGYESLEALRAANPRVTQYTRQQVFNAAPFVVTDEPRDF